MTKARFHSLSKERPLLLDGATGTELFKRGLPPGAPPEKWVHEHPDVIQGLHREYIEAGSDIVLACTFGANRVKLRDHRLEREVRDLNRDLVRISRAVVPEGRFLFGDMSPTGQLIEPFGPFSFEETVDVYKEQATALLEGGVDGFMIETMIDLQETRAALLAVREVAPDLPVIAGLTYEKNGKTIGGTAPEVALATLQALGADAVGCNCSSGPDEMLVLLEAMLPYARVPVFIKPNAGMPQFVNGKNVYNLSPDDFAAAVLRGVGLGAGIVGGCCGTTPGHIAAVRRAVDGAADSFVRENRPKRLVVTSSRKLVDFSPVEGRPAPLRIVGERINPTGKKAFQAELLDGKLDRILTFADEQDNAGADLLDVNLGLGGIDEAAMLRAAVSLLAPATPLPLAVDSVDPDAMAAALRLYPGRALVNSVSGESDRLEKILPLAARYGAAVIVLPVADGHIPDSAPERLALVDEIVRRAEAAGVSAADILVDGLAMTVSADPNAAISALDTLSGCRDRGLATILGLSNISFGMPERKWLNAVFMAMAMDRGLRAVIANPAAGLLFETKIAADALLGRHNGTAAYIEHFAPDDGDPIPAAPTTPEAAAPRRPRKRDGGSDGDAVTAASAGNVPAGPAALAAESILKGRVKQAAGLAREAVSAGTAAGALVSDHLVPAIMKAGDLFEKGRYFLPQLMLSGEAMRLALAEIEPDLKRDRPEESGSGKGRIVMATVHGDVHDIGKNLVTLMLRNHGFVVEDIGKDVPAEAVVAAAREYGAGVVGLSALMTTTLASMKKTIGQIRKDLPSVKIMVGGAAVTEHFAEEAGADGFSSDAVGAVRLAARLLGVAAE
ncbi:MAG: homocysteine S-methyltransferase family protein [Planctomycetaceae bacterium]|nr:homocysteine S-methyltransferase family protein [Planctomycetaceae bacterium]